MPDLSSIIIGYIFSQLQVPARMTLSITTCLSQLTVMSSAMGKAPTTSYAEPSASSWIRRRKRRNKLWSAEEPEFSKILPADRAPR